jgi:hypothetical protein
MACGWRAGCGSCHGVHFRAGRRLGECWEHMSCWCNFGLIGWGLVGCGERHRVKGGSRPPTHLVGAPLGVCLGVQEVA